MSWKPNPYDEFPEEVFDAWVADLEARIIDALHPPRQRLFPEPERVQVAVRQPNASSVHQPNAAAAAADNDTRPDAFYEADPPSPDELLGAEIRYPAFPVPTTVDEAQRRNIEGDLDLADGSERVELNGEDQSEDDDDDDAVSSQRSEEADVVILSSSEDESEGGEEDEATDAASESEPEVEAAEESDDAEYDSDGDLVPRPAKSLLDFEAAVADDASADDDDGDTVAAQLTRDSFEDVDDMYEDDADVLPPLEQDVLPAEAGDAGARSAEPAGFVSARSLPLSRPSSTPIPTSPAAAEASPVAAAPIVTASVAAEVVDIYELSDSGDEDEADQLEDATRPSSSRAETDDADESMDEVPDEGLSAAFDAYVEAGEGEEDELAESESGEELNDDNEAGRGEIARLQGDADSMYLSQRTSETASPTPFEAYAHDQAIYGYSAAPRGPSDTHIESDELPDYSVHAPTAARLNAAYDLDTFSQAATLSTADGMLVQTEQTIEVDPSLLALDEGFPPAPLDLPVLHAEAQLAADLAAITGGAISFTAPLLEPASDPEPHAPAESGPLRQSPMSPVPSSPVDHVPASPPATIRSYLPGPEVAKRAETIEVIDSSAAAAPATALPTEKTSGSQNAPVEVHLVAEPAETVDVSVAVERDELDDSNMDVEDKADVASHETAVPAAADWAAAADVGPVLPPSPKPPGADKRSRAPPFTPFQLSPTDETASPPAAVVDDEKDELEESDRSSEVEVIDSSSPINTEMDLGDEEDDETAGEDNLLVEEEEEEDLAPPAPVVPSRTRLPLPLARKSTEQVAATHAQANPFAALSVDGLSSEDESGRSSDQDSDDHELTPVQQVLDLPDAFELEHEQAMQPGPPIVHSATPSVTEHRSPTPPNTNTLENAPSGSSLKEPELSEPLLPASPVPRSNALAAASSADEQMSQLTPPAAIPSSPTLPSTPPSAAMDLDASQPETSTSGIATPVDEFEAEHEAAMQPLPSAILDVEVEAAEEHIDELTIAAQQSLDLVEREHDAAMQPAPALVRTHIIEDEQAEASSASDSGTSISEMAIEDDPVLPISTPLHNPGEVSLPGYVEPAAEPNLPDAKAEPEPTTLITPSVPHVSEVEGSAMAEPADTRPTTPEVEAVPLSSASSEAGSSEATTSSSRLRQPSSAELTSAETPQEDKPMPVEVDGELSLPDFDDSNDGDDHDASDLLASGSGGYAGLDEIMDEVDKSSAEPLNLKRSDTPEAAVTTEVPAAVDASLTALADASSGASATDTVVVEAGTNDDDDDGDKTDGDSEGEGVGEDSDDDLVLIESRRLSGSSAPKPSPPTPPRVLPERFLAADVFTEAPEELPQPPPHVATGLTEHSSDVRHNSRTLSYHQHGSSSSAGPSTVPRAAVIAPHAGTPSPRKRTVSPERSIRAASPSRVHNSPVTRSQCVYHVLDLPGPGAGRTRFAVPYCSLSDVNAIHHEGAKIGGVASPEQNERRQPLIGDGAVEIDEALDQALTRIVGIDMVKEGHCFYLARLPPSSPSPSTARSDDSITVGSSETAGEPSTEAVDMETDTAAASPKKRKRSDADETASPSQAAAASLMSGNESDDRPSAVDRPGLDQEETSEESSTKRQRLSEEPASVPAPSRRWSFWPFTR